MSKAAIYYPAPAFFFAVSVGSGGTASQPSGSADASFQEVSGLDAKTEVETLVEGGENRYSHRLPKQGQYANLVLKRGYVTASSYLANWAADTVGSTLAAPIQPQTLVVSLLGADQSPLVTWNFNRAWPVRWMAGPLDSLKNEVLTEQMEFSYAYVTRSLAGGNG
ncbi:phage tail protein [Nitrospirillum iridis]|uniref:Phage tail-like protein n=1 Tax=Nitrospirillum iridis TaxID=765888 RepID=A0A7X0EBK3_9PROT|nr:phage tail protein [Nitrospirillum iridis]MBB6250767.1 phage tail-like protein [Nitrospirillum iridis]